jgi:uncharacterized protein YdaU (DUF1376 family)
MLRRAQRSEDLMAEFPSLPLFTDAYIADTQHLTNEEHGVYLRLLMFAWRTTKCALPDDDRRLSLMVGVTAKKWASLKPVIMEFWTLRDGLWTQKKLTAGREFVERNREQKRAAGFASSKAKALKRNDPTVTAVVQPLPTAVVTERQQSISISIIGNNSRKTSSRDSTETLVSEAKKSEPKEDMIGREFEEQFWPLYPRKVDRKDALAAYRKARKKVSFEIIIAALTAFVSDVAGKDQQYIRHAARWINGQSWENVSLSSGPLASDDWAKRLRHARRIRQWSTIEWGPLPGVEGCRVPTNLLEPGDGDGWTEMERAA